MSILFYLFIHTPFTYLISIGSDTYEYVLCTTRPIFNARVGRSTTLNRHGCNEPTNNWWAAFKGDSQQKKEEALWSSKS